MSNITPKTSPDAEITSVPRDAATDTVSHSEIPLDLDDPHRAALEQNPDHAEKLTLSIVIAVLSLAAAFICPLACGLSLITGVLVKVGTDLGDTTSLSWVVGGWSIGSSVSFSIAGKLSDIFGRRWTIINGEILTIIGAIIGATAQKTVVVVAASTILGFGIGLVFVSYAGVAEILPNKWRGIGLAVLELGANFPWTIVASLISNAFTAHNLGGWRWCYYLGIIFAVPSTIGTIFFYFPPTRPQYDFEKSRWQEIKEIDYLGTVLFSSGLTVFLVGLTWAGTPAHPWKSASVIAPIVLGFLTLAGSFAYDFTIAKQPFFPLDLFRNFRQFTVLLVLVAIAGLNFYFMTAIMPQGHLYMFTSDPTEIGVMNIPFGVGGVAGAVAAFWMKKIGHLRIQAVVSVAIQTIFTGLMATTVPDHKYAWMVFPLFACAPVSLIIIICYVIAGLHVPLRHLGLASGLIGTFRSAGGSVGNAIYNSILNSLLATQMPARITAAGLANGLPESSVAQLIAAATNNALGIPESFASVPGINPSIEIAAARAFKEAYGYAYRRVFLATIPFGVISCICAFFIDDPTKYMTNHTAVRMKKTHLGRDDTEKHEKTHHVETIQAAPEKRDDQKV